MKKCLFVLLFVLISVYVCAYAESADVTGETFSLTLPDGITPMEDINGYAGAVQDSYGENIRTAFIACDAAQIRLVTLTIADSTASAALAASNSAEALLGNNNTVFDTTYGANECSGYSCSIDSVTYDFFYLSDGKRIYCITAAGLEPEEEEALIASVAFV